jgi:hypothetical protein
MYYVLEFQAQAKLCRQHNKRAKGMNLLACRGGAVVSATRRLKISYEECNVFQLREGNGASVDLRQVLPPPPLVD